MQRGRAVQRENPVYRIETISSVYATTNDERGPEWYDSEHWTLPRNSLEPYELCDWIGTGKYSDVFTAYRGDEIVAIKVLKPVRQHKYNREAKILLNLREGPNIVKLYDVVQNPKTMQFSFVFEHVKETDSELLFKSISDIETRFYLYQVMKALQYSHSHGIMHRDVKPLNILYDRSNHKLRLIDWGLADFYHPKQRYNIHVASRNFKPIELLLDYQCYDYSIDIWSFGATMAGIVFKKSPFFRGNSDMDMVAKIVAVLGGEKLKDYMTKYGLPLPEGISKTIFRSKARPWSSFVNHSNKDLATDDALDLVDKCIRYDHTERITADEALKHPYFDPVRNMIAG